MPISTSDPAALKPRIIAEATALGFEAVGVTHAQAVQGLDARLGEFLRRGFHGDMDWLADRAEKRASPPALWEDVRAIILMGMNYGPAVDPLAVLEARRQGAISVYAQGKDYHDVIKKKLKQLGRWLAHETGTPLKVFVDTAPVMEKPLAAAAGLGWQGKHTNLVSRAFGSWLFLGAVYTSLELPSDEAESDHCGSCRRCLDICPTAAFPAPYQLDARRCISYLTIEHKGHIAREFRAAMGNRIYGCDDCLAVCPWNKYAQRARETAFHPRTALEAPALARLAALDDAAFRQLFAGSPIKRIGRDRFVRNVLIAIGNSGAPDLAPSAEARLADASPLVRAMAIWALGRLLPPTAFAALKSRHGPNEADAGVAAEWAADYQPSTPA